MWFYGFIVSSSDGPFYIYTLVHVPPPNYLRSPLVFAQMGHHCQLGDFWKKGHRQKRFKFLAFKRAGPGPWSIFASLNLSRLNVAYIWIYMPQTAVIGTIWTRGTKKTYSVNMLLYSTTIKMPKYSVYILCNPSTPFNQATQNQIIGAKQVAVLSGDKLQTEPQPWIDRNLYLFLLFTVLAKHKEAAFSTETHTLTVKIVPILAIIARLTLEQTLARSKRKSDSCVCPMF